MMKKIGPTGEDKAKLANWERTLRGSNVRQCDEAVIECISHEVKQVRTAAGINAIVQALLENDKNSRYQYSGEALRQISLANEKVITVSPDGNTAAGHVGSFPGN